MCRCGLTPVVRDVLARARNGAGLAELKQHVLAFSPRATPEKADLLLAELSQHQLLVPELLPALTADPLAHLVGQLSRVPAAADCAARLSAIGAECAQLDADGPEAAAARLPVDTRADERPRRFASGSPRHGRIRTRLSRWTPRCRCSARALPGRSRMTSAVPSTSCSGCTLPR